MFFVVVAPLFTQCKGTYMFERRAIITLCKGLHFSPEVPVLFVGKVFFKEPRHAHVFAYTREGLKQIIPTIADKVAIPQAAVPYLVAFPAEQKFTRSGF